MSVQRIGPKHYRVTVPNGTYPETLKPRYLSRRYKGTEDGAKLLEARLKGVGNPELAYVTLSCYFAEHFVPGREARGVGKSTLLYYQRGFDSVSAALGPMRLGDITAANIEDSFAALAEGSVRVRARKTLAAVFNSATKGRILPNSPLAGAVIKSGRGCKRSYEAYSVEEVGAVLNAMLGKAYEACILVMLFTGMRKEEALALDWEDIELSEDADSDTGIVTGRGRIKITRAWTINGKKPEIVSTKNESSLRTVYFEGYAYERIKELAQGRKGPLWPGRARRYVRPDAALGTWRRRVEAAGVRYIPISYLRHTFATLMFDAGEDLASVSEYIGHAKKSTTFNYYLRPQKDKKKALAASAASVFSPKPRELDANCKT